MYEGYLRVGDTEIINSARAKGYAETADCNLSWIRCDCPTLADALGEGETYEYGNIAEAPWFDLRNPESARFYGVSGVELHGLSDSTREASVSEGVLDGGVAGQPRRAGRYVRARAWLSAEGQDALEYGQAWLSAALTANRCNVHGVNCGGTSAMFFTMCPPERELVSDPPPPEPEPDEDYYPRVEAVERYLHGVETISGPLEVQTVESNNGKHWGRLVEFTMYIEQPGVYSAPRELGPMVSGWTIVEDVLRNLMPYPSAELATGAATTTAINHIRNPSMERNGNGWSATIIGGDDTPGSPFIGTFSASTINGDRSYAGRVSYRARLAGDNQTTGSGGRLTEIQYTGTIAGLASGKSVTVMVWGAAIVAQGATFDPGSEYLDASYAWRDAAGDVIGSWNSLGSVSDPDDMAGEVFSLANQVVPAGAVSITISVAANVVVVSSPDPALNRDVRIYADAAGVIEEVP